MSYVEGWQVFLREDASMFGTDVYILQRRLGEIVVAYPKTAFLQEEITYKAGEPLQPSFHLSPEMLQSFAEALKEKGVRPKDGGKTEGLFEAQSEHLKDLRKLLKL